MIFFQIKKPEDNGPVVRASISDKKVSTKMEPSKDFGSFSALLAPSLLTGKTTTVASNEDENRVTSSNRMTSDKLSTSKLSSSSLLKSEKKDETFNYLSTINDKYETNNNLSSSYNEDNNNSVNR